MDIFVEIWVVSLGIPYIDVLYAETCTHQQPGDTCDSGFWKLARNRAAVQIQEALFPKVPSTAQNLPNNFQITH